MKTILIEGNRALHGTVSISGAKNAALPLLFATLLTRDVSIFHAMPHIRDVEIALAILKTLGALITASLIKMAFLWLTLIIIVTQEQ